MGQIFVIFLKFTCSPSILELAGNQVSSRAYKDVGLAVRKIVVSTSTTTNLFV